MELPTLDFSSADACSNPQVLDQLHKAFVDIGFVFITNHGIENHKIDAAFQTSKEFFKLRLQTKLQYYHLYDGPQSSTIGYIGVEQERLNTSQPGDLKECYNVTSLGPSQIWPDVDFPFKETIMELFLSCEKLTLKILECMGRALHLEDPLLFIRAHQHMEDANKNFSALRLHYYPPLAQDASIKPGQLRCGEHVDFGSITLLFQDSIGGLQVKCSNGEYIDVPYVPNAVLVNLGALMQKWTADKYRATPHRVLIPVEDAKRQTARQSIVFFANPDNKVVIKCIDGSNKYAPVTVEDDLTERFSKIY